MLLDEYRTDCCHVGPWTWVWSDSASDERICEWPERADLPSERTADDDNSRASSLLSSTQHRPRHPQQRATQQAPPCPPQHWPRDPPTHAQHQRNQSHAQHQRSQSHAQHQRIQSHAQHLRLRPPSHEQQRADSPGLRPLARRRSRRGLVVRVGDWECDRLSVRCGSR